MFTVNFTTGNTPRCNCFQYNWFWKCVYTLCIFRLCLYSFSRDIKPYLKDRRGDAEAINLQSAYSTGKSCGVLNLQIWSVRLSVRARVHYSYYYYYWDLRAPRMTFVFGKRKLSLCDLFPSISFRSSLRCPKSDDTAQTHYILSHWWFA